MLTFSEKERGGGSNASGTKLPSGSESSTSKCRQLVMIIMRLISLAVILMIMIMMISMTMIRIMMIND